LRPCFDFIEAATAGIVDSEMEKLSLDTQLNEYIMTSLRTMWGCDLAWVRQKYGAAVAERLLSDSQSFIKTKRMIYNEDKLILTPEGRLFADGISAELFSESEL